MCIWLSFNSQRKGTSMKKSLLLSTALVAVFAATQAFARDIITGEVNISNIENKTEESFDSGYGTV